MSVSIGMCLNVSSSKSLSISLILSSSVGSE